jgi:hypothetical protein
VAAEEPDLEVDQPVELLGGRPAVGPQRVAHRRHELVAPADEDLPEQVVLVVEERVDRSDRELGQLGDLLERRLVEALAPEHLLGGVEQLGAAEVLVLEPPLLAPARLLHAWCTGHRAESRDREAARVVLNWRSGERAHNQR